MAITCYKNYGTPPNSTGVPATRTRYALASEIGLRAGHADPVRAKQTHSGPKLRFGPAATACAKAPRQPVEGRI